MTTNAVSSIGYNNYSSGCSSVDDYFGLGATTGATNIFGTYGTYGSTTNQLEYYDKMNQLSSSYTNRNQGNALSVTDQCGVLASLISEGKEDEVMTQFKKIEENLKSQGNYQNSSDEAIKATAKAIFQQTTGVSLEDAINKNCKSNFETGLCSGFHFGNADSTSKDELLAEINGTKAPTGAAKAFGNIIGAIGGVLCLGIPGLIGEHG